MSIRNCAKTLLGRNQRVKNKRPVGELSPKERGPQDSNLCGQSPSDFESDSLTTRTEPPWCSPFLAPNTTRSFSNRLSRTFLVSSRVKLLKKIAQNIIFSSTYSINYTQTNCTYRKMNCKNELQKLMACKWLFLIFVFRNHHTLLISFLIIIENYLS